MTKHKQALLTVEDVKIFILEAAKRDEVLNRQDLISYLGISEYYYKQFIKRGMPWFGSKGRKQFVLSRVKSWLIQNNISLENLD